MSVLGRSTIKRARYKCKKCGEEWYPLDTQLGLSRSSISKRLTKLISHASVFMAFKDAKKLCKEFLMISLSATLMKQTVTRIGAKLHREYEKKGKRPYTIENKENDVDTLYIEGDGSMVPVIVEGGREYKENKLGIVFNNKDIVHKNKKNGDSYAEIQKKKMVSSIAEGVEPFKKMLNAAAIEKGLNKAKNVIFLSDGASWLGKCKDEYFPNAFQILDWYHAVEHLWETAHRLFGENNKSECQEWVKPLEDLLWEGKVSVVIKYLENMALNDDKYKNRQTPLFELRGYYDANRNNMKYDEYRGKGWYIGSCAIESANKYIVSQRLKQSGMQWTIHNADAMIWARCKYFENEWDDFWDKMNLSDYLNSPVENKVAA